MSSCNLPRPLLPLRAIWHIFLGLGVKAEMNYARNFKTLWAKWNWMGAIYTALSLEHTLLEYVKRQILCSCAKPMARKWHFLNSTSRHLAQVNFFQIERIQFIANLDNLLTQPRSLLYRFRRLSIQCRCVFHSYQWESIWNDTRLQTRVHPNPLQIRHLFIHWWKPDLDQHSLLHF